MISQGLRAHIESHRDVATCYLRSLGARGGRRMARPRNQAGFACDSVGRWISQAFKSGHVRAHIVNLLVNGLQIPVALCTIIIIHVCDGVVRLVRSLGSPVAAASCVGGANDGAAFVFAFPQPLSAESRIPVHIPGDGCRNTDRSRSVRNSEIGSCRCWWPV